MNLYLTLKAIHVIAVISWMVGLLYLPRLFVYHVENNSTESSKIFKVMEKRLMKIIITKEPLLMSHINSALMSIINQYTKQFVKHVEVKVKSQVKMKYPMRFISSLLGTNRFKIFVNYVPSH